MVGKPEVLRKETRLVPWFFGSFDQLDAVSFSLFLMILSATTIQCGIEALHGINRMVAQSQR